MQAIINFDEYADIPSFKKFLEAFKGVRNYKIEENSEDERSEDENDGILDKILERSLQQSLNGKVTPYNSEEMRRKFKAKIKNAG